VSIPILEIKDLSVSFETEQGLLNVLDHVCFKIEKGKTLGLVGESGCGKSVTSMSIMRLLPQPSGKIVNGEILYDSMDLATAPSDQLRHIRGNRIAMIFQEPMTALNPVKTIGSQLLEVYKLHRKDLTKKQAYNAALEILLKVGIAEATTRMNEHPHQLSGGMRQRVVIAMALACEPDILIADEPTTALDVTIQAQILELMKSLQRELGMAMLFITHDLGVIAELCDDVAVMYAGRVVEKTTVEQLFSHARHPYSIGLLNSIPKITKDKLERLTTIEGQVPSLTDMPSGCRFQNRCEFADHSCSQQSYVLSQVSDNHTVNCHKWRLLDHG
jgi:oligopeptide/dipeptide ABC transporter ATP-binding protein